MIDRDQSPDLTGWVRAVAESVKPVLLSHFQAGMVRSLARLRRQKGVMHSAKRAPVQLRMQHLSPGKFPVGKASKEMASVGEPGTGGVPFLQHPCWPFLRHQTAQLITKASKVPSFGFAWDLYSPEVMDAVDEMSYKFSRETLDTATVDMKEAIRELKHLLREGLERGAAIGWLARKTQEIFADPARAYRIAATESSRAIHTGQIHAAKNMGATVKTWLANPSACERCLELDGKTVPIDEPFYVDPSGGPYAVWQSPPGHPHCFCDMSEEY